MPGIDTRRPTVAMVMILVEDVHHWRIRFQDFIYGYKHDDQKSSSKYTVNLACLVAKLLFRGTMNTDHGQGGGGHRTCGILGIQLKQQDRQVPNHPVGLPEAVLMAWILQTGYDDATDITEGPEIAVIRGRSYFKEVSAQMSSWLAAGAAHRKASYTIPGSSVELKAPKEWSGWDRVADMFVWKALKGDPFLKFCQKGIALRASVIADDLPPEIKAKYPRFARHCSRNYFLRDAWGIARTARLLLAQIKFTTLTDSNKHRISKAVSAALAEVAPYEAEPSNFVVLANKLQGILSRQPRLMPRHTHDGLHDVFDDLFAFSMLCASFGRIRVLEHDAGYLEFESLLLQAVNDSDVLDNSHPPSSESGSEDDDDLDWYGYFKTGPVRICDAGVILPGETADQFDHILHPLLDRGEGSGPDPGLQPSHRLDDNTSGDTERSGSGKDGATDNQSPSDIELDQIIANVKRQQVEAKSTLETIRRQQADLSTTFEVLERVKERRRAQKIEEKEAQERQRLEQEQETALQKQREAQLKALQDEDEEAERQEGAIRKRREERKRQRESLLSRSPAPFRGHGQSHHGIVMRNNKRRTEEGGEDFSSLKRVKRGG